MSKGLAPRLVSVRAPPHLPAEMDKGMSEAVGIKIRQAGSMEGLTENLPDGRVFRFLGMNLGFDVVRRSESNRHELEAHWILSRKRTKPENLWITTGSVIS